MFRFSRTAVRAVALALAVSMGSVGQTFADGHGGDYHDGHHHYHGGFYPGLYAPYGYFPAWGYFGYGYASPYDGISDPGAELRFQLRWGPPYNDYYLEHPVPYRRPIGPVEPVDPIATCASIAVHVPAGAQVWFDDTLTSTTGEWRTFETPALAPGVAHYNVRARWTDKGQVVDISRRLDVQGGAHPTVDFLQPTSTTSK